MNNVIHIDSRAFCLERHPQAKCHRLEHRSRVWYAITLDGADVSLFDRPPVGSHTEQSAWRKLANIIREIEAAGEL